MKERKRAKWKASRLRTSGVDADGQAVQGYVSEDTQTGRSAPPTPLLEGRGVQAVPEEAPSQSTSRAASRTREGPDRRRDVSGYFPDQVSPQSAGTGYLTAANLSEHDQQNKDEGETLLVDDGVAVPTSKRPDRSGSVVSEVVEEVVRESEEIQGEQQDEDESEEDEDLPGDGDEEGVTLRDRQDVSLQRAFHPPPADWLTNQPQPRLSTSNTPSVYPSGNLRCTRNLDQSLVTRKRPSTQYHQQQQSDTSYLATSCGHSSLGGGYHFFASWPR